MLHNKEPKLKLNDKRTKGIEAYADFKQMLRQKHLSMSIGISFSKLWSYL